MEVELCGSRMSPKPGHKIDPKGGPKSSQQSVPNLEAKSSKPVKFIAFLSLRASGRGPEMSPESDPKHAQK